VVALSVPGVRKDPGVGIEVSVATLRDIRIIGPVKIESGLLTHSLMGMG
jgi:hypothetical protein